MKRSGVIASLLLLAGCVGSSFSRPYDAYGDAPPDSLRGQCERTVYEDPKVKEALARSAGTAGADDIKALAEIKREAVQRCLNQRGGVGTGGGVELPRR